MWRPHQTRHTLPVPGIARQTAMPLARWAEHRPENCGRPRAPSRGEDEAWPIFSRAPGPATVASRLSAKRYRVRSLVPCPRSEVRVAATRARTAIVRGCESPARVGQARASCDRTTSFGSVAPTEIPETTAQKDDSEIGNVHLCNNLLW